SYRSFRRARTACGQNLARPAELPTRVDPVNRFAGSPPVLAALDRVHWGQLFAVIRRGCNPDLKWYMLYYRLTRHPGGKGCSSNPDFWVARVDTAKPQNHARINRRTAGN